MGHDLLCHHQFHFPDSQSHLQTCCLGSEHQLGNTLRYLEQGPQEKELDFLAEQFSLLTAADAGAGTVQEAWPNGFFKVFLVGQNKV